MSKRSVIELFFGRIFLFFHLLFSPLSGWSTMVRQAALSYVVTIIVALVAHQVGRPNLTHSPKHV